MSKTIAQALNSALDRLDVEVLLAFVLKVPRSFLYAHPEKYLSDDEFILFEKCLARRKQGEPIAYITGHQEFWSLDFVVTPDTLIPRPETELLVESVLKNILGDKKLIADLGTGSGAIALAIASEKPNWEIHATDQNKNALNIAKQNAENLKIKNVFFHQGNWCSALPKNILFDAIVSNPPYVAFDEKHLMNIETQYEPKEALFADQNGLAALFNIIQHAKDHLVSTGTLFLEHGLNQSSFIQAFLKEHDYQNIQTINDLAGLPRVTFGCKKG